MAEQLTVFHFDDDRPSFDDLARENGFRHWSARQLSKLLGYVTWDSFTGAINKAMGVCATVGTMIDEHFQQTRSVIDGAPQQDWKLSRFACYLVAMNGDPKKPEVAKAQAYFAAIAVEFQRAITGIEDVERVEIREQISQRDMALCRTAKAHGVEQYAFFMDAGYRGLYNMSLRELKEYKGFEKKGRPLLDFMGKRELAANLFRLTETDARINSGDVRGQRELERTAHAVGTEVRQVMLRDGGEAPENLQLAPDIKKIETDLKRTAKGLKAGDEEGRHAAGA